MSDSISTKACNVCREDLPTTSFCVRRASVDGLSYTCRACTKVIARRVYEEKRDVYKARAAEWARANPERRAEIAKASAKKHRAAKNAKSREYVRQWRQENLEVARERGRAAAKLWRQRNPELANKRSAESRKRMQETHPERERLRAVVTTQSRRRQLKGQRLDVNVVHRLVSAARGRCSYCGCEAKLTLDHLTPVSRGGGNEWDNLLPACRSCNTSKGAKDLADWLFEKHGVEGLVRALAALTTTKKVMRRFHPDAPRKVVEVQVDQ